MRGLRTILFGIEPTDPMTLVSVGVSLMLVALVAVAVPALRAMRVDPVTALRAQRTFQSSRGSKFQRLVRSEFQGSNPWNRCRTKPLEFLEPLEPLEPCSI